MMQSANGKKFLLLVEDNRDDEELTLRALRKNKAKAEILVARDGAEAIDFLFSQGVYSERQSQELPQVVLLDLKLPKVSGIDVLKKIRQNPITKSLPVVILTSSNEVSDIQNGYLSGANSYIRKPVDIQDFTHAVQQIGVYWMELNQPPN